MSTYFYQVPRRRMVLDCTIASAIISGTKLHISDYSRFSFKLRCKAIIAVAAQASDLGILSEEKTKGVK